VALVSIFEDLLHGFVAVISPETLLFAVLGVLIGTMVGVLPGISPSITIGLLLPVALTLDNKVAALIMFAGIYAGAMYGGSTAAILVNTPGESASVATSLEGYQMARRGRARQALATAAIGSFVAASLAIVCLTFAAEPLARLASKVAPAHYFLIMLLALMTVTALVGSSIVRGLLSLVFGLALSLVGLDELTAVMRWNPGVPELSGGFEMIVVVIGLFALGEVLHNVAKPLRKAKEHIIALDAADPGPAGHASTRGDRPAVAGASVALSEAGLVDDRVGGAGSGDGDGGGHGQAKWILRVILAVAAGLFSLPGIFIWALPRENLTSAVLSVAAVSLALTATLLSSMLVLARGPVAWSERVLRALAPAGRVLGLSWMSRQDWARSFFPWLRGAAFGFPIGALPAGGAEIPTFLSYSYEKKRSKHKAEFGKGAIEGVAGPEAANNASFAGVLATLLTLGIPTSATAAVMLGALREFQLYPGREMFAPGGPGWQLIASLYICNIMLLVVNLPLIRIWVLVLKVPKPILFSGIMIFVAVAATTRGVVQLLICLVIGIVAFFMRRFGFPLAPAILGFILAYDMETHFRRALLFSNDEASVFVGDPFAITLLTAATLALLLPFLPKIVGRLSGRSGGRKLAFSDDD
jgi:TctA family transporter